jgi:hypothetical protein
LDAIWLHDASKKNARDNSYFIPNYMQSWRSPIITPPRLRKL